MHQSDRNLRYAIKKLNVGIASIVVGEVLFVLGERITYVETKSVLVASPIHSQEDINMAYRKGDEVVV